MKTLTDLIAEETETIPEPPEFEPRYSLAHYPPIACRTCRMNANNPDRLTGLPWWVMLCHATEKEQLDCTSEILVGG